MIVARAPFRISFVGGGTDYPIFFRRYGGAVVLTAIDRYSYIAVHQLSAFYPYRYRISYARTELCHAATEVEHPLVRECLLRAAPDARLEITHIADLPGGCGLGSSSAFTVALLHALYGWQERHPEPRQLAEEAIEIERERVGDPGGCQDQYAAAFGGWLRLDFEPTGAVRVKALAPTRERIAAVEEAMLLLYTGALKAATDVGRQMKVAATERTDLLLQLRDLVDPFERSLLSDAPLSGLGELLDRAWQLKRQLAPGITFPALEDAYACARAEGAWGGKLLGAGGRGFLLVLAPVERHQAIVRRLSPWPAIRVRTGADGSRIVYRDER